MIVPRDPQERLTPAQQLLLELAYPDAYMERVAVAMRIALDRDACCDLLKGLAVDPSRLDPVELSRAKQASHVRLVTPLELLEGVAA